jgi:predicted alpha/beta hydrolase
MLAARTADGIALQIDRVPAVGDRRGVVVCLHAMMTDGRYFGARKPDGFAHELARGGFDVLVPDFRGHGRSVPPRAGPDDWSFDDLVELDLPAIVAAAACPPSELVLLGHSLGGLVTMAALGIGAIPPPRLVVLPATSVWLLGPHGPLRRRLLMSAYRHVTALLGRAPIRALRAGTADEAATYVRQLTGWTRTARWTSLRGADYRANLARIETPVLPFVGAGDWMCTPADARDFVARIPNAAPVRVVGTQHGDALDPDHFALFTRSELRPFWRELLDRL